MKNQTSLLLIDDDPTLLFGLDGVLSREGYKTYTTQSGEQGLDIAKRVNPDLILCDVMMPSPNGFDILKHLSQHPETENIPFIFLTARTVEKDKVHGLLLGADDYIIKPFLKDELLARIQAVLRRRRKAMEIAMQSSDQEIFHLRTEIASLMRTSKVDWEKFVDSLFHMLAMRDNETEEHTQRVTQLTEQTAKALGMTGDAVTHIRWGAILHDIGKVGIPDSILLKPGSLTDEERAVMMLHPQIANQILMPLGLPAAALEIPLRHHEKWDGTGYPGSLEGEKIPLSARIFALADVWDALTNDRPYRKAWDHWKVVEYIQDQSGKHFDPHLVDIFINKILPNRKRSA